MKDREMSTGIPKSVREAMSRQAVMGPHPAADQLNAYAERALTAPEDTLVAGHLATCADCREVVFLANSAVEIPAQPVESAEVERRMGWLRWVMPATAVLALAIGFLVIQRNDLRRNAPPQAQEAKTIEQPRDGSLKDEYSGGSAAKTAETPQPAAADVVSAKPAVTLKSAPLAAPKALNELAKKQSAETKTRDKAEVQDGKLLADQRQPNTSFDVAASAQPVIRGERGKAGAMGAVAGGVVSETNPVKATQNLQITNAQFANAQNTQNANLAMGGPSQLRTNQIQNQNIASSYKADNMPVKDADMTAAVQPPAPPPPSPSKHPTALPTETTPLNLETTFAAKTVEMDAQPQKQHNFVSRVAITVWRVTSDGHLERMMQDQWKRALGGVQQSFRAVAYLQNHVWAGGRGPALYHSADGGENWNTIKVKTTDSELQGTMQSIKASDDKHVAVIADDGTVWVTADGGRTWTKQ